MIGGGRITELLASTGSLPLSPFRSLLPRPGLLEFGVAYFEDPSFEMVGTTVLTDFQLFNVEFLFRILSMVLNCVIRL